MEASCAEVPQGCQEESLSDLALPTAQLPLDEIVQAVAIALASLLVLAALRAWWLGREPEEALVVTPMAVPEIRLIEEAPPGEIRWRTLRRQRGPGTSGVRC
jgi:hypothetical protein